MAKETISVRLSQETLERLNIMAQATGRTRAGLMSHAIEKYVAMESWQVAGIQQAVNELADDQADLAAHEDVAYWLQSWGGDNEITPPCK